MPQTNCLSHRQTPSIHTFPTAQFGGVWQILLLSETDNLTRLPESVHHYLCLNDFLRLTSFYDGRLLLPLRVAVLNSYKRLRTWSGDMLCELVHFKHTPAFTTSICYCPVWAHWLLQCHQKAQHLFPRWQMRKWGHAAFQSQFDSDCTLMEAN